MYSELRQLNLPAALEALERPVGLPPSLLRKAEEVRLEDGPSKIEASIEDVERLAHQDLAILEEVFVLHLGELTITNCRHQALDTLDNEASEDEAARKDHPLNRLKSHEANIELIDKANRYRDILSQAAESDESVRLKWDEWEQSIIELTLDEVRFARQYTSCTTDSHLGNLGSISSIHNRVFVCANHSTGKGNAAACPCSPREARGA